MRRAFTLIELLIVVGIIAILAAIAVPNMLEAQVRAKVSRIRADMRTMATSIEAYCVDNNAYPVDGTMPPYHGLNELTTPVAYQTSRFYDAFHRGKDSEGNPEVLQMGTGNPQNDSGPAREWILVSYGADLIDSTKDTTSYPQTLIAMPYDPTNGTVSLGDVYRFCQVPHPKIFDAGS